MVLMDSQVWEPLIKNPALSSLLRVGYRTTQRKRRQMISRLGGAGFIMKKTKQKKGTRIKVQTWAQTNELTQEVFQFPFFFDEYDSYDGAGCKERTAEEEES